MLVYCFFVLCLSPRPLFLGGDGFKNYLPLQNNNMRLMTCASAATRTCRSQPKAVNVIIVFVHKYHRHNTLHIQLNDTSDRIAMCHWPVHISVFTFSFACLLMKTHSLECMICVWSDKQDTTYV
jgi:hypothetical protein